MYFCRGLSLETQVRFSSSSTKFKQNSSSSLLAWCKPFNSGGITYFQVYIFLTVYILFVYLLTRVIFLFVKRKKSHGIFYMASEVKNPDEPFS